MRRVMPLLAIVVLSGQVGAQILQPPPSSGTSKRLWVSGGIGWLGLQGVQDGSTSSTWDFGGALQYRASVEMEVSGGWTLGIDGSYARVPLTYQASLVDDAAVCTTGAVLGQCDADATVQSAYLMLGSPAARGFHQVFSFMVGATRFSGFQARESGATLRPDSDLDFGFAVGYGFGWGFSPTKEIQFVPEYADNFHQHDGLPGGARTMTQNVALRVSLRLGF